MYNHNKAQQSKNRVHISWDILYVSKPRCGEKCVDFEPKFYRSQISCRVILLPSSAQGREWYELTHRGKLHQRT